MKLKYNTTWIRNPLNPVLPPISGSAYDNSNVMNPWCLKDEESGQYRLYYGGGVAGGHRRICLATVDFDEVNDPTQWERHGPLFDVGEPGSFDGDWCVLPHAVKQEDGSLRIYYTGNSGIGTSLDRFPGLGVAISEDGKTFRKHENNPIIPVSGKPGDSDALGIAGGSVLQVTLPDGSREWRFYYTGCPTLGGDVFLDQQKRICLAVSSDGLNWEKRGTVMVRDPHRDYENIAVAGPVVSQHADGSYRMWYSAIGTRWGFYSICYAESQDGLTWNKGSNYGDNLQLGPQPNSRWENQMVEYPSVIQEADGSMRLFYTGNGYGKGGVGTAVSTPLRATPDGNAVHVADTRKGSAWKVTAPQSITWNGGSHEGSSPIIWHGPDHTGTIWYEDTIKPGLDLRVIVSHHAEGLQLRVTLMNDTEHALKDVQLVIDSTALAPGQQILLSTWEDPFVDLEPGIVHTAVGYLRLAE
ncbi:MAG: hypothetical protein K0R67_761 [Paenibacillus sp.]|jgi:predicted GH43/DUF377 family glycosyl hydrolase|nr:hypothetical protein [Paenibacillus sp.]